MLTILKTTKNTLVSIWHALSSGCMPVVMPTFQAIRAVETAGNSSAAVHSPNKKQIKRLHSLIQIYLIIPVLIPNLYIKRMDFSFQINNYAFFFVYSLLVLMITLPSCISNRIGFRKVEMKL